MFTLTVHMAPKGTPLLNSIDPSIKGHMWYTLDDGSGKPLSFGFAPVDGATGWGRGFGPGDVHGSDNTNYLNTDPSKPIETRSVEISQAEYNTMKNFGKDPEAYRFSKQYNALTNSCIDFTWKAMQAAGLNDAQIEGAILPKWNKDEVQYTWDQLQKTKLSDWTADITVDATGRVTVYPICKPDQIRYVDPNVNTKTTDAQNWTQPRDPLVLDLDGDGIEAVGINPSAPILFDMDGNGTKHGTGWIKADDGIVVRDLNGNGLIDSGRELFGDRTVLQNGPKAGQTAANGYEALADLDLNGDAVLNSADAAYSQLRIWQDTNQNGISESTELHTLGELGIASINVAGTASNVNLGNGNTQPFSGSFTRTNGSTGTSGVAEVTGSLLLANNNFYREFSDDPAIAATAAALPQMQGSGWGDDLSEAMSLGTPEALALQAKVNVVTINSIASCACKSLARGYFYYERRRCKSTKQCLRWRFDHSNTKTAHARFIRVAK